MSRGRIAVAVRVHAPAQAVWDAVTNWPAQSDWIPATRVRAVDGDGQGVGGRIEAYTGFGRLGFLDTMVVTEWRPPHRCAVRHTGKVVRGTAAFAVEEAGADGDSPSDAVRLVWYEDLELPAGVVGAIGWRLIRRSVGLGIGWSLNRLARSVERSVGRV